MTRSARGERVVTLSQSVDGLDVTDQACVDRILAGIDGPFDTVIVALGILGTPEKSLREIDAEQMAAVMAVNAIGPALILRHMPRLLAKGGKVAVLSARVGSIGDNRAGGWYSYRASKAALNQLVKTASVELSRVNAGSVCVALHPGTVETPFTRAFAGRHPMVTPDEAATNLWRVVGNLTPEQTGGFFAYSGARVDW